MTNPGSTPPSATSPAPNATTGGLNPGNTSISYDTVTAPYGNTPGPYYGNTPGPYYGDTPSPRYNPAPPGQSAPGVVFNTAAPLPPAGVYGPPAGYAPRPAAEIKTYLAQAILVALLCCMPFGVVSIVYAAQVSSRAAAGDYAGASELSRKAKLWAMIGAGAGLAFVLIYVLFVALAVVSGPGDWS